MSATLLKKMSAKTICGNVKEEVKQIGEDGEVALLYKVWGIASGIRTGDGPTGPWLGFTGSFGALRASTGEAFSSGEVFLPNPLPGMLEEALRENEKVEFGLEVFVKRRDDLAIGYEYLAKPVVQAQQADPLQHLKDQMLPPPAEEQAPPKSTAKAKEKA